MCQGCWVDYGSPREDFSTKEDLVAQIKEYYLDGNGAGGSLHIVLDDWNLEDAHVEFCAEWALDHDDPEGFALAKHLHALTVEQRASALAAVDGF